jgi:spore germination protein GerM
MKRFHLIGYTALLICISLAGFACSSASNTASDAKPEVNAASAPSGGAASASRPAPSPASSPAAESTPAATTDEVDIYLVAVGDKGEKGLKIGCDDSLVRVTRKIKPTVAPLRAAIEELLAAPHEYSKELGNYWRGKNLKLKSVSITEGVATIHISGEGPYVAGVCDKPRITEQIENTAMQFSSVNTVKVFVNDKPLADAIR